MRLKNLDIRIATQSSLSLNIQANYICLRCNPSPHKANSQLFTSTLYLASLNLCEVINHESMKLPSPLTGTPISAIERRHIIWIYCQYLDIWASLVAQMVKNQSACNTGDPSLIPDWEDSMEKGMNGNPLHYSCLENFMDREAWQDIVHGVTKNQMQLSNQTTTNRTDKLLLGDISHWLTHEEVVYIGVYFGVSHSWVLGLLLVYFIGLQNHCRWWLQP